MNDLFDTSGQFRADNAKPQHEPSSTVKQRRQQLAAVIDDCAPDVAVIVEGPNSTRELQRFFDADVEGTWQCAIQPTAGSSQCTGVAVRTDRGLLHATTPLKFFDTTERPEFGLFHLQDEMDGLETAFSFERLPLYVEVKTAAGAAFRILGLHLKSKGIFTAYEWSKWWAVADAARKKILAQTTQVRTQFLDKYLTEPTTASTPIIVCGDINDGPGLDASEKRLLGSGIERLMGNVWRPRLCLGNALFDSLPERDRTALDFSSLYTVAFRDPIFNNMTHEEWIDHILYSCPPGGQPFVQDGRVMRTLANGKDVLKTHKWASDHYPVTARVVV